MEDTNFCRDLLQNEVSELMDIDALCQLKEVVEDDDENEDEDDAIEDVDPKEPISFELVHALATQLKALSVQIGDMGEEYASASIDASDASEKIRSTFRKSNNELRAVKQKFARQPLMSAFLKK